MSRQQKLELTWIGKEIRPKLEPRILVEDPAKSYHAKHRVTDRDVFDNRLIFGDNLLAVFWMGRDDNRPAGLTGSSGALQLWTDIMQTIKPQPLTLIPPDGVTMIPFIDGKRVAEGCPEAKDFPFIDPFYPEITPCKGAVSGSRKTPESKPWSLFDIFR